MALNFPSNPTIGDIYIDDTSGFSYEWDGTVWQSYTAAATKNISILDDISGSFDGIQDTFSLAVSGTSFTPANSQQLIIVLGGVVQEPSVDYNVSGTNIVFSTPPTGGLSFSGISLGPSIPLSVPNDGTVTPAKLSTGGPSWNTSGDVYISGIATITNASGTVTVGVGTTALLVEGNARVTGILTVGSSSITLDGTNNQITVGSGVTISSQGLTLNSLNASGIITASSFSGDGSGLTGVGVGTEDSINTSGIITASTISANEFVGTGDKLIFSPSPTAFSPTDGSVDTDVNLTISITFDQNIEVGVGSISIRDGSASGTELESIGIGSTNISGQTLTIYPSQFPTNTDIYVVLPQGVVTNSLKGNNAAINTYNFTTIDFALTSTDPLNGATNVGIGTSITLTFTSPPSRGTGSVELKQGSVDGSIIESFDAASSGQISISGNKWILTPSSNLGYSTSIHPVIPNGAITNYTGINTVGAALTYSFETRPLQLGDAYGGGTLICQSGGVRWVVAPNTSEVSRNWYARNDAVTRAQQVSGCTGWFVPTCGQLQNPGYTCRIYWDSYCSTSYWSSTENISHRAWRVDLNSGAASNYGQKTNTHCVRAFRCVSY